jgi:DNA polymerase-1
MKKVVFDIETDGLYNEVSTIHCVTLHDLDSRETLVFNDQGSRSPISAAISFLGDAEWVIGHNVINYDIPVIRKFYPWVNLNGRALDTLLLSRLKYPDLLARDSALKLSGMPPKLYGRHSLEAWGYRLGTQKGDFGKTADWSEWSQEMEDYNVQDANVTVNLWERFRKTYPGLP